MRTRNLILGALLAAIVLVPTLARADSYTDPFAASSHCHAQHLPNHHVRGMHSTPYKVCVKALRKLQAHHKLTAKAACKAEGRKHVRGLKGTPYTRCVAAGKRLRKG